jgi:hypothetical protein
LEDVVANLTKSGRAMEKETLRLDSAGPKEFDLTLKGIEKEGERKYNHRWEW